MVAHRKVKSTPVPPAPKGLRWVRVNKYCEILDIDRATVYRAMKDGRLPYVIAGSQRRVPLPAAVQEGATA